MREISFQQPLRPNFRSIKRAEPAIEQDGGLRGERATRRAGGAPGRPRSEIPLSADPADGPVAVNPLPESLPRLSPKDVQQDFPAPGPESLPRLSPKDVQQDFPAPGPEGLPPGAEDFGRLGSRGGWGLIGGDLGGPEGPANPVEENPCGGRSGSRGGQAFNFGDGNRPGAAGFLS